MLCVSRRCRPVSMLQLLQPPHSHAHLCMRCSVHQGVAMRSHADLFLSGSDDGVVRQTDIREPVHGSSSHPNEATSASENASIVGVWLHVSTRAHAAHWNPRGAYAQDPCKLALLSPERRYQTGHRNDWLQV